MKSRRRRRRKGVPLGCLFGLLILLLLCAAGIYGYQRFGPTKERVNLEAYYDAGGDKGVAVFLNYERQDCRGIYENGQTYLPLRWVNAELNERFYWDSGEKVLSYALPEEIVTADLDSTGSEGQPLLLEREDEVYLSLGLILNYTDIRCQLYDGDALKRIYMENTWNTETKARVKWSGKIRQRGGLRSPVLTEISRGATVTVLETMEHWSRVMTEDGHIGYLYNRKLSDPYEETPVSTFEAPVYTNISLDEKITLAWHQVTIDAANEKMEQLTAAAAGKMNVIAPTWFTLSDNEGNYESLASKSYVEKAHEKGLQVWAVVDNFSKECSQNVQSEVLLSKTSVRRRLIDRLMEEADTYGFDGINLDFESLKSEAGVHYIQFIRELSVSCRKKGLVLSVDNYVPAPYNRFYNQKEQGIVADYVIIMGYDEHYAGGDIGSVSSIGYVKNGIEDMLELVPKEKVINGVPFYTRLWTKNGDQVSSKAMGISEAMKWVEESGMELSWNEETGQYYGELESEGTKTQLWMEETRSLGLKMELIKQHALAGVAAWKLGMEPAEVWDVICWD